MTNDRVYVHTPYSWREIFECHIGRNFKNNVTKARSHSVQCFRSYSASSVTARRLVVLARDHGGNSPDEKYSQGHVVLVTAHLEVIFQAGQASIANVSPVHQSAPQGSRAYVHTSCRKGTHRSRYASKYSTATLGNIQVLGKSLRESCRDNLQSE